VIDYFHSQGLILFDQLDIDFDPGFNVFSGESGSGKTVLLKSIGQGLGDSADASLVAEKITDIEIGIKGTIPSPLEEYPEDEEALTLTKVLRKGQSSISRVNGRKAARAEIKTASQDICQIIGQHHSRMLVSLKYQLELIDRQIDSGLLKKMSDSFKHLEAAKKSFQELQQRLEEAERVASIVEADIEIFDQINPQPGELEEISSQLDRLKKGEKITAALNKVDSVISSDQGLDDQISNLIDNNLIDSAPAVVDLLEQSKDLLRQASSKSAEMLAEYDPILLEELKDRSEELLTLERRFRSNDLNEIRNRIETDRQSLSELEQKDFLIKKHQNSIQDALKQAEINADNLTQARQKAAESFCKRVDKQLVKLGFKSAKILFEIEETELKITGKDKLSLKLQANKDLEPVALGEGASGGELSRLMLAILLESSSDYNGCYLFDEIDTGISGQTAHAVGKALSDLSKRHQLIVITHLPQVAQHADRHFLIEKDENSQVIQLDDQGIEKELSRLMGLEKNSQAVEELRASSEKDC
jgi:DNA repair protein RecN (Recombination protein N)